MRQILVKGLDTDVQLSPIGGAVIRPGIAKTTLTLGFRFFLSDSAQQGTYVWPMRLAISPA